MSCSPSGKPSADKPPGTEIPGKPAMFTVTVNTSLRYISIGSGALLADAEGGRWRRGGEDRIHAFGKDFFEIALDQRAYLLCAQVVGVVIAGRKHVGADHDAPAHLLAETARARVLVHVGDVASGNAQTIAHAVVAREIG